MKKDRTGSLTILLVSLMLAVVGSVLAQEADSTPPPDWYLEHNDFLSRDGGLFHADNSEHRSENEPWEAYGLAWEKGPSGLTLRGRLFGVRDGRESGTFWEFFVYWHAGEAKAYMIQVNGSGGVGIGVLDPPSADGSHRSEQTFYRPGGEPTRIAHVVRNEGDVHDTQSFDWVGGAWEPRRRYVWTRGRAQVD